MNVYKFKRRYREEVEAVRVTVDNMQCIVKWITDNNCHATVGAHCIIIDTVDGRVVAPPGSYIVKDMFGDIYPVGAYVFHNTFKVFDSYNDKACQH